MKTSQRSLRSCLLIGGALIFVALAVACGDRDTTTLAEPKQISCERLINDSYRYHVEAVQDFGDTNPEFIPEATPPLSFPIWTFSERLEGEVEDGSQVHVSFYTTDGGNVGGIEIIDLGDTSYSKLIDQPGGWEKVDTTIRRSITVRYRPSLVCEGLMLDFDLSTLETRGREEVSGIVSYRYDINGKDLGFLARSGDFGLSSDIGAYAHEYTGSIWIAAEGGYPSRVDLVSNGHYPDGRRISIDFLFEISDMGGDVKVEAPDIQ